MNYTNEERIAAAKEFWRKAGAFAGTAAVLLAKLVFAGSAFLAKHAFILLKALTLLTAWALKSANSGLDALFVWIFGNAGKVPPFSYLSPVALGRSAKASSFLAKTAALSVAALYSLSIFAPSYLAHLHNEYALALNSYEVWQGNRRDASLQSEKDSMKDEYAALLRNEVFSKLGKILELKKEQCVNREVTDFLYWYPQETGEAPPAEIVAMARAEADFSTCSVMNLKADVYKHLVKAPFETELASSFANFESSMKTEEDSKYSKEKQIVADEAKAALVSSAAIDVDKLASEKAKSKLKAVFCSYGHGMGRNGWVDNGARAADGTTERSLIEPVVGKACDLIAKGLEGTGIKVYRIGEEKKTLLEKIAEVNKISEDNGYDATNSILFELHWNKVGDVTRSGTLIFFGQDKTSADGFQGEALASRMLKSLKRNHNFGNYYAVMNDRYCKWGQLGIVTDTKPNAVLIEYGFLSNLKDVEFSKENLGKIAQDIADAFVGFAKP